MKPFSIVILILSVVAASVILVIRMLGYGQLADLELMYWILAGLVLAVGLSSAVNRWLPILYYRKSKADMEFDAPVNFRKMTRMRIKTGLRIGLLLIFGLIFSAFTFSILYGFALWFLALEQIVHFTLNKKHFRIGVTSTGLFALAPSLITARWATVKMVERKYDDLFITTKHGVVRNLNVGGLSVDDQQSLHDLICSKADEYGFHVTESVSQSISSE